MIDKELLQAIQSGLRKLIAAAQSLDEFVEALAIEAERSASRIRELAGKPPELTSGNAGTLKRRGRPPGSKIAQAETPPDPAASTPSALGDSDVPVNG